MQKIWGRGGLVHSVPVDYLPSRSYSCSPPVYRRLYVNFMVSFEGVAQETPGNDLNVTGLSPRITQRQLAKQFSSEGEVVAVHLVVMDPWARESVVLVSLQCRIFGRQTTVLGSTMLQLAIKRTLQKLQAMGDRISKSVLTVIWQRKKQIILSLLQLRPNILTLSPDVYARYIIFMREAYAR